jgi:hypothetical protein
MEMRAWMSGGVSRSSQWGGFVLLDTHRFGDEVAADSGAALGNLPYVAGGQRWHQSQSFVQDGGHVLQLQRGVDGDLVVAREGSSDLLLQLLITLRVGQQIKYDTAERCRCGLCSRDQQQSDVVENLILCHPSFFDAVGVVFHDGCHEVGALRIRRHSLVSLVLGIS